MRARKHDIEEKKDDDVRTEINDNGAVITYVDNSAHNKYVIELSYSDLGALMTAIEQARAKKGLSPKPV